MKLRILATVFLLSACQSDSSSDEPSGSSSGNTDSTPITTQTVDLSTCNLLGFDRTAEEQAQLYCAASPDSWRAVNQPIPLPEGSGEFASFDYILTTSDQTLLAIDDIPNRLFRVGSGNQLSEVVVADEFVSAVTFNDQVWLQTRDDSNRTHVVKLLADNSLTTALPTMFDELSLTLIESYSRDTLWVYDWRNKQLYKQSETGTETLVFGGSATIVDEALADQLLFNHNKTLLAGDTSVLVWDHHNDNTDTAKFWFIDQAAGQICSAELNKADLYSKDGEITYVYAAWNEADSSLYLVHKYYNPSDYNDNGYVVDRVQVGSDCTTSIENNLAENDSVNAGTLKGALIDAGSITFYYQHVLTSSDGFMSMTVLNETSGGEPFDLWSMSAR